MNEHLRACRLSKLLLIGCLTAAMSGCRPDLPTDDSLPLGMTAPPELAVKLEPESSLDAAPRALRARVQWVETIDVRRVFLVRGEVSDHQLRQIERDEISKALTERIVPSVVWAEDDHTVVIAPTVMLERGQAYAVASGDPRKAVHFVVAKEGDEPPMLERVWPPSDMATSGQLGIFCGPVQLPNLSMEIALDPLGPVGTMSRGIAPHGAGADCVRFEVFGRWPSDGAPKMVLPPRIELPGSARTIVQLEPTVFEAVKEAGEEVAPLECERDEVRFGLGCVQVQDDRLLGRTPASDLLLGIKGEGIDLVMHTGSKQRFVLKGLPAETAIELDVVAMDPFGRTLRETFSATTQPLSSHVILNEVMANPLGPEPHQEWVELYNDGQVEAMLAGYRLLDIGGDTALPDAVLLPGQLAVLVSETFVEDPEIDVPPAPGTIMLRVPTLGKSGLSNAGELLRLVDSNGLTISRFPALPKPKAGQSVSRRFPSAPDGVSDSFSISSPTPGLPNEVLGTP